MFLFEYDIIMSYMKEFQHLNVQLLLNYFMLPYIHKCLLFGLRKVKNNWQYLCIFEIVLHGLASNLQPLYETFNVIASWFFLFWFSTYRRFDRFILYFIYIYIYIYKESYWLYILISITLWLFNWYQTFYSSDKDKQHV